MANCPTCDYASPEGTRFCRQCGSQLPAVASGSAPLPPTIGDAVQGDTLRYQQPMQAAAFPYTPPVRVAMPTPNTASFTKKRRRFLKFGGFFLALLISGGIGAAINESANDDRIFVSREDRVRLERLRTEDEISQTMTGSVTERQERLREDLRRRLEAIQRAKEDADRALERGDLVPSDEKTLDVTAYEYKDATSGQYSRVPGRELLTQRTSDDFETVTKFYQEKLGRPFVQISERNRREAIFQSTTTPSVTVLVREERNNARRPEIMILRSPFRFPIVQQPDQEKPKPEDSQKAPTAAKQTAK